jgi:hypothetical protein
LEAVQTLQEEFSPPEGQAGKSLVLKMQVEYSANYISHTDLKQLVTSTLGATTSQGFSNFGELTFNPLTEPLTDSSGITHFELQADQVTLRDVDQMHVFSAIRGHNPDRAVNELKNDFTLRDDPQITITPAWWPWLPLIPFNISVEVR